MQLQNAFIPLQQVTTVGEFANRIGAVRALLSGANDETPLINAQGTPSLVTADSNAIAYSRTPQVQANHVCKYISKKVLTSMHLAEESSACIFYIHLHITEGTFSPDTFSDLI